MTITTLMQDIDNEILKLRRIRRLVEHLNLDPIELKTYVESGNETELRNLVWQQRAPKNLSEMPLRKLRKLASEHKIPNYHLLPKPSLLSELAKFEKGAVCASK